MEYEAEHVGRMEAQLTQWGKKLDALTAKTEKAGTAAKSDYNERIADLKGKYRATQSRLAEFKTGAHGSWDTFRVGFGSAWDELELAFKKLTNQ